MSFVTCVKGLRYDPRALSEACDFVLERIRPDVTSRGADRFRGVSLTHRVGAVDPFSDGSNSQFDASGRKVYRESEFSQFNAQLMDTYFWEIYRSLPFRVGRMRIMILPPLTVYGMHRDATQRAHLAVVTNPDCWLVARSGESFHVPDDGRVYVAETREEHTAFNAGSTERVHLAISVVDTEQG